LETTIATYIQSETEHVLGTDIFLAHLPKGTEEGLIVRFDTDVFNEINFNRFNVNILIMYQDYVVSRNNFEELLILFNSKRGTLDGSWTVSSEVTGRYLGLDRNFNRYAFSVEFEIHYEQTT
jgi:hypothetical protein